MAYYYQHKFLLEPGPLTNFFVKADFFLVVVRGSVGNVTSLRQEMCIRRQVDKTTFWKVYVVWFHYNATGNSVAAVWTELNQLSTAPQHAEVALDWT